MWLVNKYDLCTYACVYVGNIYKCYAIIKNNGIGLNLLT